MIYEPLSGIDLSWDYPTLDVLVKYEKFCVRLARWRNVMGWERAKGLFEQASEYASWEPSPAEIGVLAAVYAKELPVISKQFAPPNIRGFTLRTLRKFERFGLCFVLGKDVFRTKQGWRYWTEIARERGLKE